MAQNGPIFSKLFLIRCTGKPLKPSLPPSSITIISGVYLSSIRSIRAIPSGDDRRFAVSGLPTNSIGGGDVSQTDAVKLMSASTGFFQTLVDAIRFGFLTREEVNRICSSLEQGCEDNFKTITITHPCLKWWKNDVSKLAMKIGDDTGFKRDFW